MLSNKQRDKIRDAFTAGTLKVQSVSPEGVVEWKRVCHVQRAEVPWETIIEGETTQGSFVLTAGHRVYLRPDHKKEAKNLSTGDHLLAVNKEGETIPLLLRSQREVQKRQFMYDLTAEDWHNFVLYRSRVVISNSPDRNYHFRPPEHEGKIGSFNRVFGQIWEDAELYEYLMRAVSWWDMFPPGTNICTLDNLGNTHLNWSTAIYWSAISHAIFAVALNWVADEFDYSIGGVSLSIDKSSKYESLKQNAESMFDKATEAKARTVKYIRGLQQPRFGIGIRSAFGAHVGRGVLSPRSFIVLPIFLTLGGFLGSVLSQASGMVA